MAHANAALVQRFYESFQRHDAEGMVACYHPDVTFSDPVFTGLDARQARAMWRMLVDRAKDLKLEFSGVEANETEGRAHWEAWYSFSATKRQVHNVIDATFTFEGGLIRTHQDRFGLWRWSRMALGPAGVLFGWLPPMQGAIKKKAMKGLDDFIAARGEAATKVA